jgi:hypothetical protein
MVEATVGGAELCRPEDGRPLGHDRAADLGCRRVNDCPCTQARTRDLSGGITRRSWLAHQRRTVRDTTSAPRAKHSELHPLPSDFRKVYQEIPDVIATLPELTGTQQKLLERLRVEGTVVLDGRWRKTIEPLVRRGLATYEAEYVLGESDYYIFRFTVRLKRDQ